MFEVQGRGSYQPGWPQPIGFSVVYAERRNRLTVAVRAILALPQLIVIGLLGFVSAIVAFVSWCAALVLGRLPTWAARFQVGFLAWSIRVQAYYLLLVDAYPPFAMLAPPSYPLQLAVPEPGRLNRSAVFFRIILAIPAGLVATLAATGVSIVAVATWVILVIGGRMPRNLFQAMASALRYQMRYYAYFLLMVTPTYPGGLFAEPLVTGDWGEPVAAPDASTADASTGWPGSPGPPDTPTAASPGPPGWPGSQAGLPQWSGGQGTAVPSPAAPISSWSAVAVPLAGGAKAIVATILTLGLVGQILYSVYVAPNLFNLSGLEAEAQLVVAHQQLVTADQQATSVYQACVDHGSEFSCAESYDAAQGSAYASFASTLSGIEYPRSSQADAEALLAEAEEAGRAFLSVSGAPSQSAFQAEVNRQDLSMLARTVQQDYAALDARLSKFFG